MSSETILLLPYDEKIPRIFDILGRLAKARNLRVEEHEKVGNGEDQTVTYEVFEGALLRYRVKHRKKYNHEYGEGGYRQNNFTLLSAAGNRLLEDEIESSWHTLSDDSEDYPGSTNRCVKIHYKDRLAREILGLIKKEVRQEQIKELTKKREEITLEEFNRVYNSLTPEELARIKSSDWVHLREKIDYGIKLDTLCNSCGEEQECCLHGDTSQFQVDYWDDYWHICLNCHNQSHDTISSSSNQPYHIPSCPFCGFSWERFEITKIDLN